MAMHRLRPTATCARAIASDPRNAGMVDRDSGRAVSRVRYRHHRAMAAADDAGRTRREEFAGAINVAVTEVV